eukprot:TRINITY_DN32471_c0_g1_i1.p1 TRINITY_DN32471_c0_g1~~TRINITY_DN32471_c0_g1_i1.p1  ORF type:complete len:561 (+),score=104.80 TRINITY_DN32471_c0_g1_i1:214-1896(+)
MDAMTSAHERRRQQVPGSYGTLEEGQGPPPGVTAVPSRSDLDDAVQDAENHYELTPAESIYSFHLFMVPLYQGHPGFAGVAFFAYFLVVMNFVMQFGLIVIVGAFVADNHSTFVQSIAHFEHPWYDWSHWFDWKKMDEEDHDSDCRSSASLCYEVNGMWTCAPPSVHALSSWSNLDLDRDGLWSRAEAGQEQHRKNIQCQYGVDSLELFDRTLDNIVKDPLLKGRLHFNLTEGIGIPQVYFDYYKYLPLLCQYGDEDLCGTMFERGVFDAAIKLGKDKANLIPIYDFTSARNFCAEHLSKTCKAVLPHSYREWLARLDEKCGKRTYTHMEYQSPGGKEWTLPEVHFETVEKMESLNSMKYQFYFSILLFTFFAIMMEESKNIYRVYVFVIQRGQIKDAPYADSHRWMVLLINFGRSYLWINVLYTGTQFLTCGSDYLGLIFDAISLVFIIEIDDLLYRTVLRGQLKATHEDVETVVMRRWHIVHVMFMEALTVCVVMAGVLYVTYVNKVSNFVPLQEAILCLCDVVGSQCYESTIFDRAWWDHYWLRVQPAAFKGINAIL